MAIFFYSTPFELRGIGHVFYKFRGVYLQAVNGHDITPVQYNRPPLLHYPCVFS